MYEIKLTEREKEALLGAMMIALDEGQFSNDVDFYDLYYKIEKSKDL